MEYKDYVDEAIFFLTLTSVVFCLTLYIFIEFIYKHAMVDSESGGESKTHEMEILDTAGYTSSVVCINYHSSIVISNNLLKVI